MVRKIPTQNHQKKTTTIFWHINRADWLEKQILSGKICGIKSRGRQCTKYTDSLSNYVMRKEYSNNELIWRTDNREDWKTMIADVCDRPGTWWWWWLCLILNCIQFIEKNIFCLIWGSGYVIKLIDVTSLFCSLFITQWM